MSEEDWSEHRGEEPLWYHLLGYCFLGILAFGLVKLAELIEYVF